MIGKEKTLKSEGSGEYSQRNKDKVLQPVHQGDLDFP